MNEEIIKEYSNIWEHLPSRTLEAIMQISFASSFQPREGTQHLAMHILKKIYDETKINIIYGTVDPKSDVYEFATSVTQSEVTELGAVLDTDAVLAQIEAMFISEISEKIIEEIRVGHFLTLISGPFMSRLYTKHIKLPTNRPYVCVKLIYKLE